MKTVENLFDEIFSPTGLKEIFAEKIQESRTVGRDGVRPAAFEARIDQEIDIIIRKIAQKKYKFTKYKVKLISKGAGSPPRVLSIPTVRDKLTLRGLCNFLTELYPEALIKKPHSYIKDIRSRLNTIGPDHVFLRIDVKSYYPSINNERLINILKRRIKSDKIIHLIRSAIINSTTNNSTEKGVPQGLSISNILSSIYLQNFDRHMMRDHIYYRYVDDILILCEEKKAKPLYQSIKRSLKTRSLQCHPLGTGAKSCISFLEEGTEYLGFLITKEKISVRKSSHQKMMSRIQSALTHHKHRHNEARLVWKLNLKITGCILNGKNYGWLFFFSQTEDLKQLSRLDFFIKRQLTRIGQPELHGNVKRFIKSYHEMRYNLRSTKYIPNFDTYTIEEMKRDLTLMRKAPSNIDTIPHDEVKKIFFFALEKEVQELEEDLLAIS